MSEQQQPDLPTDQDDVEGQRLGATVRPSLAEGYSLIKISVYRIAAALALSAALAGIGALPVAARPHDGRNPNTPRVVAFKIDRDCPLRRIDRQLVRCDNWTGAGVPAPLFIPEL
jgi:hypothetical protein